MGDRRTFCTQGPANPTEHFCVTRVDELRYYSKAVESRKFVLFINHSLAGKTTLLDQIRVHLQSQGFRVFKYLFVSESFFSFAVAGSILQLLLFRLMTARLFTVSSLTKC